MVLCIGGGNKAIPRLIRNKRTTDAKLVHLLHATPFEVYIFTGAVSNTAWLFTYPSEKGQANCF